MYAQHQSHGLVVYKVHVCRSLLQVGCFYEQNINVPNTALSSDLYMPQQPPTQSQRKCFAFYLSVTPSLPYIHPRVRVCLLHAVICVLAALAAVFRSVDLANIQHRPL